MRTVRVAIVYESPPTRWKIGNAEMREKEFRECGLRVAGLEQDLDHFISFENLEGRWILSELLASYSPLCLVRRMVLLWRLPAVV